MMDAVKEGDVGTTQPVESLSIEPLAQHVTPEKEVATVPTVPKKEDAKGLLHEREDTKGIVTAQLGQPRPNSANHRTIASKGCCVSPL